MGEDAPPGETRLDRALLSAGFALGIVGGLLLASTFVADLPPLLVVVGLIAFVSGMACAFAFGARDARREGTSIASAMWRGLRTMWQWLWAFMP